MKRRIREKIAVRKALQAKIVMFGDSHSPESRMQRKIRLAIDRQKRPVQWVGDQCLGS